MKWWSLWILKLKALRCKNKSGFRDIERDEKLWLLVVSKDCSVTESHRWLNPLRWRSNSILRLAVPSAKKPSLVLSTRFCQQKVWRPSWTLSFTHLGTHILWRQSAREETHMTWRSASATTSSAVWRPQIGLSTASLAMWFANTGHWNAKWTDTWPVPSGWATSRPS